MYVECLVHLCVSTKQTQRCPDPCTETTDKALVNSIQTHNYTIRSGPVRLIKATETSSTTAIPSLTAVPVAKPSTSHTSSHSKGFTRIYTNSAQTCVQSLTQHMSKYVCSSLFQLWIEVHSG